MEKTVNGKYLRTSVKKLRTLTMGLKGKKAITTIQWLLLQPQQATALIAGTLKSGVHLFDESKRPELVIKKISVDQGPVFKRWRAGSKGMAKKYSKKTAHLKITLLIKDNKVKTDGK